MTVFKQALVFLVLLGTCVVSAQNHTTVIGGVALRGSGATGLDTVAEEHDQLFKAGVVKANDFSPLALVDSPLSTSKAQASTTALGHTCECDCIEEEEWPLIKATIDKEVLATRCDEMDPEWFKEACNPSDTLNACQCDCVTRDTLATCWDCLILLRSIRYCQEKEEDAEIYRMVTISVLLYLFIFLLWSVYSLWKKKKRVERVKITFVGLKQDFYSTNDPFEKLRIIQEMQKLVDQLDHE